MSRLELTILEVENGYRIIEGSHYGEISRHHTIPKEHVAENISKLAEIVVELAESKHAHLNQRLDKSEI